MATLAQARNLFQRAQESGDYSKLGAYMAELLQPAAPRVYKGKRGGKEVFPAPIIQTIFADGRMCRMSICQLEGQPLPTDKAIGIAQSIYSDFVCAEVPPVISCERVNGTPRPAECGLIRYAPKYQALAA